MPPKSEPRSPHSSVLSTSSPSRGARAVARDVLLKVEQDGAFADELLDDTLRRAHLDSRDRALVFELVYGVLRHRATLDWRLGHVSDRSLGRVPNHVKTALRLGAYQLLYLEKIPPSAAVNESVALVKGRAEKAKAETRRDWTGFVNAVLRSLLRAPVPPWPDPDKDPVAALSIRYSCPAWLVERWLNHVGLAQAEARCRATLAIPPLTIRVNTLRVGRDALERDLVQAGYQVRRTPVSPVGLVLEKSGPIFDIPQFREGAFYVEDEAAQLVPPLLTPQPGERILDACAAPGGKATHLAALMQNQGELVAMDRSAARLRLLQENCARLGVRIVTPVTGDAAHMSRLKALERPFDRILLDAPCSGLGTLRRHPEGKWGKTAALLERQQAAQERLLEQVARLLRPGGVLVYSTCSTEPEENEDVIDRFCREHAAFRREPIGPWLPAAGQGLLTAQGDLSTLSAPESMDGFFAARLRKADR